MRTADRHVRGKPWVGKAQRRLRIGADARRGLFLLSRNKKKPVDRVLGDLVRQALAEEDRAGRIHRRLQESAALALRDYEIAEDGFDIVEDD